MILQPVPNNAFIPLSQKGVANGVATLDSSVLIPLAQIPATLTGKDADTLDGSHGSAFVLLAGLSSGQTIKGGTGSGENLTLMSTAYATKGKILFGNSVYDEVNNRLGIGTTTPSKTLEVNGDITTSAENKFLYARYAVGSDAYISALGFSATGGILQLGNNGPNYIRAGTTVTGGYFRFIVNNTALPIAAHNGIEAMEINVAGNVGIGISSPVISGTGKLHMAADTFRLDTARTPASAGAAGNTGEVCWDADYIYVAVGVNTWRRVAHNTW